MEYSNMLDVLKNEPRYRIDQIKQAIFVELLDDWSKATWLPQTLRNTLQRKFPLAMNAEVSIGADAQTVKALVTFEDGKAIETVLMKHNGGRNTVCVSTQVGCPMRCAFCATGTMGLIRNLSSDEIVTQVLFFARYLKDSGERVGSVVFMGMGEPLLNYQNVIDAIKLMNDPKGLNIGARHFSISTAGILDGIKKLSHEQLDVNLAISLHAPNDEIRKKLMPIAQAHHMELLLETVDEYIEKKNRKVMFEYLLIDGQNDADEHARELAEVMNSHRLYMVNLIPYNPTVVNAQFKPSPKKRVELFKKILERAGVEVTVRTEFGGDIKGACGQLATERNEQKR
jgi:23S rRNA (adenine2503-C2)-methyltransferase